MFSCRWRGGSASWGERSLSDPHEIYTIKRLPFKIHTVAVCAIKTKSSCEGRGRESQKRENERKRRRQSEMKSQKSNHRFVRVSHSHSRSPRSIIGDIFIINTHTFCTGFVQVHSRDSANNKWLPGSILAGAAGAPACRGGRDMVREKIS